MTTCAHLNEVRHALTAGQWPHAAAPELRSHAATCNRCAQEILITTHLQQARSAAIVSAQPGTPNLLWWRAQLIRRNLAVERASRPIAAAQAFALIIVFITMTCLVAAHWHSLLDPTLPARAAASLVSIRGDWGITPLILAFTLIPTLGAVVLYLSTERE